jgi:hypothetical protein
LPACSIYWTSRTGRIPWNLIAFIDYCTDRIFLRHVGGGRILIHRMLMEHFATMAQEAQEGEFSGGATAVLGAGGFEEKIFRIEDIF